jgi:phosphate transport system substrate-binding protein
MRSCKKIFASWSFAAGACLLVLSAAQLLSQERISIVGSGSNVPSHLYTAWTDEFDKKNANIQVRYLSMSTVEGIRQISEGSGDFAAGEIPLSPEQMHGSKVSLTQFPTVLVGLVPIYELPGNPELNFSGEVLAQIYLGTIKTWKDPHIAKLNPGGNLPDLPITVVHRTSGKGSNYIFTDFLSKTSPDFRSQVGVNASPKWPLGVDANRGEDMIEKVASTPGAVGYVELNFARRADIGYGNVKNAAGKFTRATPASISAACIALEKSIPKDFRVSLTNAPGKDSYPISSFTWLYVPSSEESSERKRALGKFLNWALDDGQGLARGMGYATLPPTILSKARAAAVSSAR